MQFRQTGFQRIFFAMVTVGAITSTFGQASASPTLVTRNNMSDLIEAVRNFLHPPPAPAAPATGSGTDDMRSMQGNMFDQVSVPGVTAPMSVPGDVDATDEISITPSQAPPEVQNANNGTSTPPTETSGDKSSNTSSFQGQRSTSSGGLNSTSISDDKSTSNSSTPNSSASNGSGTETEGQTNMTSDATSLTGAAFSKVFIVVATCLTATCIAGL